MFLPTVSQQLPVFLEFLHFSKLLSPQLSNNHSSPCHQPFELFPKLLDSSKNEGPNRPQPQSIDSSPCQSFFDVVGATDAFVVGVAADAFAGVSYWLIYLNEAPISGIESMAT